MVSGGGGLIQDATGIASVLYYMGVVLLARTLRVPFAVYAQGLGPLRARSSRLLVRLLQGAEMITLRDQESADLLSEMGVCRPRPEVTADAVFALPQPVRDGSWPDALSAVGVCPGRPVVALAPRQWGGAGFAPYLTELAMGLRDQLGSQVVLLPMQWTEDTQICTTVAAAAGAGVVVLPPPLGTTTFAALFGAFDLVIGMRLHALILSSLARVPFIGLSYDPKITSFMKSVGAKDATFALMAPCAEVLDCAGQALQRGGLSPALQERIAALQQRALRNNQALSQVLQGKAHA